MKDWTIMVYMAGDNNLSADMAYALEEIHEAAQAAGEKINLLVYCDSAAFGAPTFYCDFTNYESPVWQESYLVADKPYKLKKKSKKTDAELFRDENSGAIYSILNFVDWCVNKTEWTDETGAAQKGRRARRYALIFSGHSTAFQNMSFLIDTTSNQYMTIPKLRWSLKEITREDGNLLKQKIDILGFDSCVMGMLELGFGFRNLAKTMVASEGNIPSAGWSYGKILADLIADSANPDEKKIARRFVTNFIKQQNRYAVGGISVDMAAWDLSAVEDVAEATDELAKRFNEILDDSSAPEFSLLKNALFSAHWQCQSYMLEQNVDLKDFCQLLACDLQQTDPQDKTGLLRLCEDVAAAVDRCILMCGFSGGSYQYSNGISIFFPWTGLSFNTSRENYEVLSVFGHEKLNNWFRFLDRLLNQLTIRECRRQVSSAGVNGDSFAVKNWYHPIARNNHLANDKNNHLANDKNNHLANDKNNHLANDKNNHLANDKNNHLANDKNNHMANDKNNHLANDKNNHMANDKGSYLLLLTQFKNTQAPWNICGFTKETESSEQFKNAEV